MAGKRKPKKSKRKSSQRAKATKPKKDNTKYLFITGGVVSGIGKGITAAAVGTLLRSRGISFFQIKIDPYLNRDAGTMNPYQHGEVFVLKDGKETDLDLGHYERFSGVELDKRSNFTTGGVYHSVLKMERRGEYLGKTIQIIPHVTDEIKRRIVTAGRERKAEVVIIELGGTVGDIEGEPFLEAARQMQYEFGMNRVAFMHVVKIDYIFPSNEEKTKPIQQSVILLRARGIQPDFLVVRCKESVAKDNYKKVSLFTNVPEERIVEACDVKTIYEVPVRFKDAGLDALLIERLGLRSRKNDMKEWRALLRKISRAKKVVKIALVGKYTAHTDSYLSVEEALRHAALHLGVCVEIMRCDADSKNFMRDIKNADGVLVPGGFGRRGGEGKIKAVEYARTHKVPFLGLCLGLQIAVIEFARHACGLKRANSTEFDKRTPHPVVAILPEQLQVKELGGTMRLGAQGIILKKESKAEALYGARKVHERHRHRYEVNPDYREALESNGLVISGTAERASHLVDMIELEDHPFFVGTQAHPEFLSRFLHPHPLFTGFIKAIIKPPRVKKLARPKLGEGGNKDKSLKTKDNSKKPKKTEKKLKLKDKRLKKKVIKKKPKLKKSKK